MTLQSALQHFTKEIREFENDQVIPPNDIRKKINAIMVDHGEQSQDTSCARCMNRMFSRAVTILNTKPKRKKRVKKINEQKGK